MTESTWTDWQEWNVEYGVPTNSEGTPHNGRMDALSGWECFLHCPACDQDSGNVCESCGEPATWGHHHDCPERPRELGAPDPDNHPAEDPEWIEQRRQGLLEHPEPPTPSVADIIRDATHHPLK